MEEFFNVLKEYILFKNVGEGNLQAVLNCLNAYVRHYAKGETISKAGGVVAEVGVVVKGNAYVYKIDMQGNRMILRELQAGHSFGESVALADMKNSPVAITAATNCSVVFIPVRKIIENNPLACDVTIRENLITLLAQKNIALLLKNDIISKKTIRERLMTYFYYQVCAAGSSKISTALTKEELADYLCVNRSAMSRELSKMKQEGLIAHTKNSFTIKIKFNDDKFELN